MFEVVVCDAAAIKLQQGNMLLGVGVGNEKTQLGGNGAADHSVELVWYWVKTGDVAFIHE